MNHLHDCILAWILAFFKDAPPRSTQDGLTSPCRPSKRLLRDRRNPPERSKRVLPMILNSPLEHNLSLRPTERSGQAPDTFLISDSDNERTAAGRSIHRCSRVRAADPLALARVTFRALPWEDFRKLHRSNRRKEKERERERKGRREGHGNDSTDPFPSFPFSKQEYIAGGGGFGCGEDLPGCSKRLPSSVRSPLHNTNGEVRTKCPAAG